MSFDWKTEDLDWEKDPRRDPEPALPDDLYKGIELVNDEPAAESAAPARRLPRRRSLIVVAVIGVLLLAATGLIYRQVDQRAEAGRERAETDVLASDELVRSADANGDAELFVSVLSGSDPQWATDVTSLVAGRALNDRSSFGFHPSASTEPSGEKVVTLAPDLHSAELAVSQAYDVAIGAGLTETITLTQTAVYRRGPDRWLLAPPLDEFWGETESVIGRYTLFTYPARDEAIAQRLIRDIEAVAAELCGSVEGGACARLHVNFSPDPAALLAYQEPLERLRGGSEVVVPTPTLLGLPGDEAGYRALFREYAARVVAAYAANYAGWVCCEHASFYVLLLEAQLNALGLRPWAAEANTFEWLIDDPLVIEAHWHNTNADAIHPGVSPVRGFVDFLVNGTNHRPILAMQRSLLADSTITFWGWLQEATNGQYGPSGEFERAFMSYAASRRTVAAPPTPLPAYELQAICRVIGAANASLYRLDPLTGAPAHEYDFDPLEMPILAALPGRDGVVLSGMQVPDERAVRAPFIWRDGQATAINLEVDGVINAIRQSFIPLPLVPNREAPLFASSLASLETSPIYAELTGDCTADEKCAVDAWRGVPYKSPDGAHVLRAVGDPTALSPGLAAPILYLVNEQGQSVFVGSGSSSFWLDNNTFGYVAPQPGNAGQAIILYDILPDTTLFGPALSEPTVLLTTAALRELPLDPYAEIYIDRVLPSRDGSRLLIITANPRGLGRVSYVLEYVLATGAISGQYGFTGDAPDQQRVYHLSPDGRWLVIAARQQPIISERQDIWALHLYNAGGPGGSGLGAARVQRLAAENSWHAPWQFDWTPDGQWLAITTNGYVRLFNPDENYIHPLIVDGMACSAAVWVNEE